MKFENVGRKFRYRITENQQCRRLGFGGRLIIWLDGILIYFAPSGSYHQSFLRIHGNGNKFKQGTIVSLFKFVHSDTPIKV